MNNKLWIGLSEKNDNGSHWESVKLEPATTLAEIWSRKHWDTVPEFSLTTELEFHTYIFDSRINAFIRNSLYLCSVDSYFFCLNSLYLQPSEKTLLELLWVGLKVCATNKEVKVEVEVKEVVFIFIFLIVNNKLDLIGTLSYTIHLNKY